MWYIVILCGEDWYTIYQGWFAVRCDVGPSIEVLLRKSGAIRESVFVQDIIGPFRSKPKQATDSNSFDFTKGE